VGHLRPPVGRGVEGPAGDADDARHPRIGLEERHEPVAERPGRAGDRYDETGVALAHRRDGTGDAEWLVVAPYPEDVVATDGDAQPSLRRLLDAMLSVGSGLELPAVLRRVIEAATELVDARYGALGVLDDTGTGLSEFLTVGV